MIILDKPWYLITPFSDKLENDKLNIEYSLKKEYSILLKCTQFTAFTFQLQNKKQTGKCLSSPKFI